MSTPSSTLRRNVNILGVVVFASHLVLAILSYVQAVALWNAAEFPRAAAFFEHLGSTSVAVTANPFTWLAASRLFTDNATVMLTQAIPLAIVTVAAALTVLMLTRPGNNADAAIARLLFGWSLAFAAASFFAYPLFTQDFWLSAVWGRMAAAGINPFHTLFAADKLSGLPLDHFPMTMSYGPLWAVISALIALVSWNNAVAMALLFKALISAAWVSALVVVDNLQQDKPGRERCLSIALFGWVPLGVSQSIAEGHNDIVMIAPALLWLLLLLRGNAAAPLALAASVLCKYVTAPLFLVDLIAALRRERLTFVSYMRRMLLPTLLGIACVALFFRSMSFFDGVRMVSEWYFLRPSEAVSGLEQLTGIQLRPLHVVALAVFPVVAVYSLAAAARKASNENLTKAAVAVIAALTFGAASHLWPWYLVWGIAFSALTPQWWVARFLAGVALLIPFALATWWIPSLEPLQNVVALAIYVGASLWVVLTREHPPAAVR
jgi:alpha-1,6-mannosyltransferase